jgi:hypothetical protein
MLTNCVKAKNLYLMALIVGSGLNCSIVVQAGTSLKTQETEIDRVSRGVELKQSSEDGYRSPDFTFSPNLEQVAYIGHDQAGDVLISGSKRSEHFPVINRPLYSPPGNLLIALAESGGNFAYIVNLFR